MPSDATHLRYVAELEGSCNGECNPPPHTGEWCTECVMRRELLSAAVEIERLEQENAKVIQVCEGYGHDLDEMAQGGLRLLAERDAVIEQLRQRIEWAWTAVHGDPLFGPATEDDLYQAIINLHRHEPKQEK